MLVRCTRLEGGLGPSEVLVAVPTSDGRPEEVIVSSKSLCDDTLVVSGPLVRQGMTMLVELPRESVTGRWRIWVAEADVRKEPALEAAE